MLTADVFDDALAQHLTILFGTVVPALCIGVPLGIWCTFSASRQGPIFAVLNIIQTILRRVVWFVDCAACWTG